MSKKDLTQDGRRKQLESTKPEDHNDIGKWLAQLRISRGLTREELAERVGVTPSNLEKTETGHRSPSLKLVSRIMNELSVSNLPADILSRHVQRHWPRDDK